MDFEFSEDTSMLREMLQRFLKQDVRSLEMKFFNTGVLTPEERLRLRQSVQQMGLWGATLPERYGGLGLDLVSVCALEETLGTTFVPVELGDVPPMLFACAGEQTTRYLEPAVAGERRPILAVREPSALRPEEWSATAAEAEAGFRLSGRKLLAAVPGPEDFLIVYARGQDGPTAFLLDAEQPGARVYVNGDIQLELDECGVGRGALLGEPGGALTLGAETTPGTWVRTGARFVGIATRLLEMALDHAREWVSLGAPLRARPAIQRLLAEGRVDLESARWLVYHAAWLGDQGQANRQAAAEVRLGAGEMLYRTIDRVTMIYAGPGPAPQLDPQRLVRSLISAEALELSLTYARAAIAAAMLGESGGR